jgi:hypothetical protein
VVVRLACEAQRRAAVVHQDCGSSAEGCGSSTGCDSQERDVVVVQWEYGSWECCVLMAPSL